MARVPAIMLASTLLGASSLRRKSNRSNVNGTNPQDCEGHTQAAPAGWAVQCDNRVDTFSSGLRMLGNYGTTYDDCWRRCRESEGCEVVYFKNTPFLSIGSCQYFQVVEDQGGLCFRTSPILLPSDSEYVYYNAELLAPNPNQDDCEKVNPGAPCEEYQAQSRPGWTLSCDQGFDYDEMPGAKRATGHLLSGGELIMCQRNCEEKDNCLGIDVRIRESFPSLWSCGLLYDRSRYEPGQEEPLSVCSTAKPPFPYTKHHVMTLNKRSVLTNCSA